MPIDGKSWAPGAWVLDVVTVGYQIVFTSTPPEGEGRTITPIPKNLDQGRALETEIPAL